MAIEEKYSMIYQLFNISYINEDQNENEQYNKCRRDGKMKRDNKMTIQLDETQRIHAKQFKSELI